MLPKKMLPAKCSPKNALQKMLHKTKCSTKQNAPQRKMLPVKMLPEKKCSSENLLDRSSPNEVGVRYIGTSIRLD